MITAKPAHPSLASIDWSAPWLAPYASIGQGIATQIAAGVPGYAALNASLAAPSTPVRFVAQGDLPVGEAYESYIFRSNCCPTREGLHDFFNGLAWLQFPLTKRRLNHLHVAQIAHTGIQPVRGPARDALTVFDENAAFFQGPDVVWDALATKDWRRLFVTLRPLWAQVQLVVFGHALLEKLVAPRKAMTAHVYRVQAAGFSAGPPQGVDLGFCQTRPLGAESCGSQPACAGWDRTKSPCLWHGPVQGATRSGRAWGLHSIAEVDAWMAAELSADKLAGKPFAHLPVLGVPGWWPGSDEPSFYADATVFRPARPKLTQGTG